MSYSKLAPEQLPAAFAPAENPVFLISGELPGTGSTSVAEQITSVIHQHSGILPFKRNFGEEMKHYLNVHNEAELSKALDEIPNPQLFDEQFYTDVPADRPAVLEGKLATRLGPEYLTDGRPLVRVSLTAAELFSAKRILAREGYGIESIFGVYDRRPSELIIEYLEHIHDRKKHDDEMRDALPTRLSVPAERMKDYQIDTSHFLAQEVAARIITGEDFTGHVPDWELQRLREANGKLMQISALMEGNILPQDREHIRHQIETITYHTNRLEVILHPDGIAKVRHELRKSIVDCWFGLMMKRIPRFFTTDNTESGERKLIFDSESHTWSPEYYKVAEAWPVLSSLLKDKTVLDPFAGAGSFLNLLVARGIVHEANYTDIAYKGGKPINGRRELYVPKLNMEAAQLLFDDLPSWYKPNFGLVNTIEQADAQHLPFEDDSVDYVCTDPPYGKNCDPGGLGITLGSLDECLRVARSGAIMMVPLRWLDDLKNFGNIRVEELTGDISRGTSGLPVCYVRITRAADNPRAAAIPKPETRS